MADKKATTRKKVGVKKSGNIVLEEEESRIKESQIRLCSHKDQITQTRAIRYRDRTGWETKAHFADRKRTGD